VPVRVVHVDPHTDRIWHRLVTEKGSSVFHSLEWMRVLTDTYGLQVGAYVVLDAAGEPKAGIPYCRISDILGERIVTLPFSDYCDPLVDDPEDWDSLIATLAGEGYPFFIRCLRSDLALKDERFTLMKQAKWHGLDSRPDLDMIWRTLDDSARRAIRKAQREGIVVYITQEERALREFYEMHLSVRKYKYRLLAQPYRMFENIWRHFIAEQRGFLMVAASRRGIIGGVIFLQWRNALYYKFNASVLTELSHRPNDLLIWEGIKFAKRNGYSELDFGLSACDQEGLVRYKRKFATEERTIYFLASAQEGETAHRQKRARNLLVQLTDLFTDESLPDGVTEKAGEVLYKYFT
jgi:CelD/BcsL family acetyltransferase involved in cellulose biosynthesis